MTRFAIVLLVVTGCGKKSKPVPTHDDAAVGAAMHAPEGPALPGNDASIDAPADAAVLATHITPPPPSSSKFGHFCVKMPAGLSKCVITEAECKTFGPRCGEWKSVFCFTQPSGARCFSSAEDCKTAHDDAVHRSEPITAGCVQDEM